MSNSEFRVEYQRDKPTKRQSYRIVREPGQRGFPTPIRTLSGGDQGADAQEPAPV